ncbi:acyl-CoA thioesterase, partial [Cronobacter sakazakii]|nr:acyl-CoA thioesterase [Cronobacter sakazakii]
IRDSVIEAGFNLAQPEGTALGSQRPFNGNTGAQDDKGNIKSDLNDANANRLWEYNNRGLGSKVVAEPKK